MLSVVRVVMVKNDILALLMEGKRTAILQVLLASTEELYLTEIANRSKVPVASAYRILRELVEGRLVRRREWKTSTLYMCEQNDKTTFLKELLMEEYDGLAEFLAMAGTIPGIKDILLHGKKEKDRASLLLIGEAIDTAHIEEFCRQSKEKGFELSYVPLAQAQYTQMVRMGVYGKEKSLLQQKQKE